MTPRLNLRPEDRSLVERILAFHIPDREVVAFGSRATGNAKPMSDLDLCILGEARVPSAVLQELADAFSASSLPFKVDVIEWAAITVRFRAIVEASAVPIIGPQTSATPSFRNPARTL